jgi:DNA-directed DNA polymerase III PolC
MAGEFSLRVQSAYSFCQATLLPDEWVAFAANAGFRGILQADRNNLYGALPFLEAAKDINIPAALGAEVDVAIAGAPPAPLLLVCENLAGYRNLSHLITCLCSDVLPSEPTESLLAGNQGGLFFLASDLELLKRLATVVDSKRLVALLPWPPLTFVREDQYRQEARRLAMPLVALPLANIRSESERETLQLMNAIRHHKLIANCERRGMPPPTAQQLEDLYRGDSRAVAAGTDLIRRCTLSDSDLKPSRFIFPNLGGRGAPMLLHKLCEAGLRRYGMSRSEKARGRLARELAVISGLGFCDYFLATARVCAWARRQGIATSGRGSGVASLVAYLLGITGADPIRYNLHFERFLHPLRRDYPDIDIDVAWNRRMEVIDYMLSEFGENRGAMISTHQFFRPRGAFRAAARAMGLSDQFIKRAARTLPRLFFGEPEMKPDPLTGEMPDQQEVEAPLGHTRSEYDRMGLQALKQLGGAGDGRIERAVSLALGIVGLPNGIGIHVGGVVLSDGPMSRYVPLERSANGVVITQYEMHAIEKIGLIKIDILGNRALGSITETCEITTSDAAAGTDAIGAVLDRIAPDDQKAGELIARGDVLGCMQLESPAMRTLLKQLKTSDLPGVIAAIALIRPGPSSSGMKSSYIKRLLGEEKPVAIHPSITGLLADTQELPLYEEDVMRLAAAVTGIDYAEGDMLRRAIGEAASRGKLSGSDEMTVVRDGFLKLAWRQGNPEAAEAVWEQIQRFASYSFCKAHAAGFGVLAFQTAYLKAHLPGPFITALLNNHRGMYPRRVYVGEARRFGLTVKPPNVACSAIEWLWQDGVIRCGLGRVKGLREETPEAIFKARQEAPFRNLTDFVSRVRPTALELEALLLAGAFDEIFPLPRGALLWEAQRLARSKQSASAGFHLELRGQQALSLSVDTATSPVTTTTVTDAPPWRDISPRHRARLERRFLGLSITQHPMTIFRGAPPPKPGVIATLVAEGSGSITVTGIITATRGFRSRNGTPCRFFTLEDESGLLESTLRGPASLRENCYVTLDDIVEASGTMKTVNGARGLQIRSIKVIGHHGDS